MAVGDIRQIEAEPRQDALDRAAEALRVLQRARAMHRDAAWRRPGQRVERLGRDHLGQIACEHADALRFLRVDGVGAQQVAVFLTNAPQPLAVSTIASAPASIAGHQASILRRARARPASCAFR